jgi:hypothetical protein
MLFSTLFPNERFVANLYLKDIIEHIVGEQRDVGYKSIANQTGAYAAGLNCAGGDVCRHLHCIELV